MALKDILADKVTQFKCVNTQERDVIDWLNNKAGEIIKLASNHLKYVSHVFEEFDIHDAEHSEEVLNIIENLLGNQAEKLSYYDLFSLIAVSYLHDCGMAVSDREMEVLKMVEGVLDGQKLMAITEAKDHIRANLDTIYGHDKRGFDGEIKNWMFRPDDEETFIKYLAELLIDYQSFRNGKIDKIREFKEEELIKKNDELRTEYLRITHHERVEKYIINWGETDKGFADFPISGMGKLLAKNIAKCCRAHGEDEVFMKDEFSGETRVLYYGPNASNLQFVAMMLRLGDIIHFNYDRAHPVLRALHHFKSDYSYHQWHIKSNGVSFNISNGKVICTAFCQYPKAYYDLWTYVNFIDHELKMFNTLSPKWEKDYQKTEIDERVDRENIRHDASFTPALGHKFTLDQNKVLELLTGAELYYNDYACLRELYQNSLDACRCQIAKDKAANKESMGYIEFGIGEDERNGSNRKYVYCLDNGKGMTKEIIQKYLLHIGSSYYKSSDFFKKQAETGSTFTPTSQFGIGMLSCFMIGDEIEITTREEGRDVVSCVMEGPNEYFYYKLPSKENAEKVPNSGTLVKVYLNEKYQKLLNDDPLEKLGYLLWYSYLRDEAIEHDRERWEHHLYRIMNDFIVVVPDGVDVNIALQNPANGKEIIRIYNKPLPIIAELRPYANINNIIKDNVKSDFDKFKNMEYKIIQVQENGLECRTVIDLTEVEMRMYFDVYGGYKCCVDGIEIRSLGIRSLEIDKSVLYLLEQQRVGTLNFIGENRPQLSVSREEIIELSLSDYENDARNLLQKLIKESIKEVCSYIKDKGILPDNPLCQIIWEKLFNKFNFCCPILYRCLKGHTDCHDMQMPFIINKMSLGDVLIADETIIYKEMLNKDKFRVNNPKYSFFILRLLESESIEVKDENSLMAKVHVGIPAFVSDSEEYGSILDENYLYIHPSGYNNFWKEYDFMPFGSVKFISDDIWQIYSDYLNDKVDENDNVFTDSWIYTGLLKDYIRNILSIFNFEIDTRRKVNSLSESFSFVRVLKMIGLFYRKPTYHQVNYLGLTTYTQDYSVLAVGEPDALNWICFAWRGKHTRQELLDSIVGERREEIKNVLFLDGEVLSPQSIG